jgi:primosomal protein N' (replication factor Y)
MEKRIQVSLPIPLDKTFTYRVPPAGADHALPGCRAIVPFANRSLTGIIVEDPTALTTVEHIKDVLDLPDAEPLLTADLLALTRWIADYYCCSWGEALKAALPAGKLQSLRRTRRQEFVFPAPSCSPTVLLSKKLELLKKAPAQAKILDFFLSHPEKVPGIAVLRETGASKSALNALLISGILQKEHMPVKPFTALEALSQYDSAPLPTPNDDQNSAIRRITEDLVRGKGSVFLLYGVTGSGKTLVYQKTIERALEFGGTALVLIPEISLTPQLLGRFHALFGDRIAVQHSALSESERTAYWMGIRAGEFPIVIGARSAVFAPLQNLKLIIIDEEGDSSYKQTEPNPRYNARDVALVRARACKATVVLGGATPSIETFYNAEKGKFFRLDLPKRVDGAPPPKIRIVSPPFDRKKALGKDLVDALRRRLDAGEQAILLLNRRGFFTAALCPKCGYLCKCRHCEVSLTHHKRGSPIEELRCHICGYKTAALIACPECGAALRYIGSGTQRIEEELMQILPEAKILRLDFDNTRERGAHHRILKAFAGNEYSVLLGTKMVARGHDYPRVTLVGVVSADSELIFPDFRSDERAFVLLSQAAGRSGRKAAEPSPGEVIIQTWLPEHPVLKMVQEQRYEDFFRREIKLRRNLRYPPCGWLILFAFSSKRAEKARAAAHAFLKQAKSGLKEAEWLGPAPCHRARVKDLFRFQILMKAPLSARSTKSDFRKRLKDILSEYRTNLPSPVHFIVDVDPLQML